MTSLPGKNEGFRILDEFVCRAIPEASAVAKEATHPVAGAGENEGMQVLAEAASDALGEPIAEKDSAPDSTRERRPGGGAAKSKQSALRLPDWRALSNAQLFCVLRLTQGITEADLRLIHDVLEERLAREHVEPADIEIGSIIESIDVSRIRRRTPGG